MSDNEKNNLLETVIFDDKKLSDIIKETYDLSKEKNTKIQELVSDLSNQISSVNDAMTTVPLIKEYLEMDIKNTDQLNKLITNIQKVLATGVDEQQSGEMFLTLKQEVEKLAEDQDDAGLLEGEEDKLDDKQLDTQNKSNDLEKEHQKEHQNDQDDQEEVTDSFEEEPPDESLLK